MSENDLDEGEGLSPELQAKVEGAALIMEKFTELSREFRQVGSKKTLESVNQIPLIEKAFAELKKLIPTIKEENDPQVETLFANIKQRTEVMLQLAITEQEEKVKQYALLVPKLKKFFTVMMSVIEIFDLADYQKYKILFDVNSFKMTADGKVKEAQQNLLIFKHTLEELQATPKVVKLTKEKLGKEIDELLAKINASFPWRCPSLSN